MSDNPISLLELQQNIQNTIRQNLEMHYWIVAEISEFSVNYKGHCYLSLVEKSKRNDDVKAKARAVIWASRFRMLNAYFESASGESLKSGIKIMVKVTVDYHELYGLSLQILDIDPQYTLGDIELRRREIIKQLEEAGIIDMNKTLELPLHIQRIAIISSDTAAGFGDFIAQMETNSRHYAYSMHLFKAAMQGVDTEKTVIKALEDIYDTEDEFDVVVIIRGGGSRTDLSAFDNYEIAAHIAQFPIPVLSGIGHERDASVVDLVAYRHLKTPTAVAEFILEHTEGLEESLDYELDRLLNATRNFLNNEQAHFNQLSTRFIPSVKRSLDRQSALFNTLSGNIHRAARQDLANKKMQVNRFQFGLKNTLSHWFKNEEHKLDEKLRQVSRTENIFLNEKSYQLDRLEQLIISNDPKRLLDKGYSITTRNGKQIDSVKTLKKGEQIKTWFKDGTVDSEIL